MPTERIFARQKRRSKKKKPDSTHGLSCFSFLYRRKWISPRSDINTTINYMKLITGYYIVKRESLKRKFRLYFILQAKKKRRKEKEKAET